MTFLINFLLLDFLLNLLVCCIAKYFDFFFKQKRGSCHISSTQTCNYRGHRGGGLPCPFSKFKEKCPDFGEKCPH